MVLAELGKQLSRDARLVLHCPADDCDQSEMLFDADVIRLQLFLHPSHDVIQAVADEIGGNDDRVGIDRCRNGFDRDIEVLEDGQDLPQEADLRAGVHLLQCNACKVLAAADAGDEVRRIDRCGDLKR